jgi:hypothetical protein
MTHRLISGDVMWCSCYCRLFSFIEFFVMKGIFIVAMLTAGYTGSSCWRTAAFVKEIDSFSGVKCNPHQCKVLHCWLSTQNADSKTKCWTFLKRKCEQICPPPSQTGWLITIAAVQHGWRMVNEGKVPIPWNPKHKSGCSWEHIWCYSFVLWV